MSVSAENLRPLSEAERLYIENNATLSLWELAKALNRPVDDVQAQMPAAKTPFEKKVAPIRRNGKTIGTVCTPASSAHMDGVSGYAPGTTRTAQAPPMVEGVICTTAGTDEDPHCVHVLRN
jgi:hypothetical protein